MGGHMLREGASSAVSPSVRRPRSAGVWPAFIAIARQGICTQINRRHWRKAAESVGAGGAQTVTPRGDFFRESLPTIGKCDLFRDRVPRSDCCLTWQADRGKTLPGKVQQACSFAAAAGELAQMQRIRRQA